MHPYRSHNCGALRASDVGQTVRVAGWIHVKRNHGGVLFVDLRDHYGLTQVVIGESGPLNDAVSHLPKETVVSFTGVVDKRPADAVHKDLPTGEIELRASEFKVLGSAQPLPFDIATDQKAPEETRLRYRFLDLRRKQLQDNIILRSRIISSLRRRMVAQGFNEFQTPILTCSSPEGARDYLVPARLHPGKFYALPQAPQQFKQLLMVAGFDRYFQIAPCFRDEAARADRSPGEFYQLDVEMSFATQEDVFAVIEDVIGGVFQEFSTLPGSKGPFRHIAYADSMLKYGTDKPDLRNPLEIRDLTDLFVNSELRLFNNKTVRALAVENLGERSRSFYDSAVDVARGAGAKGLSWLTIGPDNSVQGPLAKFLDAKLTATLLERTGGKPGGAVFFCADDKQLLVCKVMGELRTWLGQQLSLIKEGVWEFCWITDFPMYELDEDTKQVVFSHNPFSMPQGGMQALLEKNPLEIKAFQYDIVCNGYELSSGAVRNHDPELMYKAFELAGYGREVVDNKFPALQRAFRFGAPPHAGIAPGVDRIVMLLAGEKNLREIVAFPMNQQAEDLLMGAPSGVEDKQLKELHIRVVEPPPPAAPAPAAPSTPKA